MIILTTGKYYKVKETLSCNSANVVYLITCQCCKLQYVGYTITFKEKFHIHESDIHISKRCGVVKHFLEFCTNEGKFENLKIKLIESVNVLDNLLEQTLW